MTDPNNPWLAGQDQGYPPQPEYPAQPAYAVRQPAGYPGQQMPMPTSPPAVPRPRSVEITTWLLIGNMILGLLQIFLPWFYYDDFHNHTVTPTGEFTAHTPRPSIPLADIIRLVINDGLGIFFIFMMRAGQNWARILLVILGSIAMILSLFGDMALTFLAADSGAVSVYLALGLSVIQKCLIIASFVFMYRSDAHRFFAWHKTRGYALPTATNAWPEGGPRG